MVQCGLGQYFGRLLHDTMAFDGSTYFLWYIKLEASCDHLILLAWPPYSLCCST